jgi:ubiquinone/menaquinone biosynthesis C-methylase UbiE
MKIEYRETSSDLLKRIDIHQQYGGRDIDAWMLEVLDLKPGARILDAGCGAGKQCFVFWDHLHGKADVTGGDVSDELLATARAANTRTGNAIRFTRLDFNRRFPFDDGSFDLLSCCFAIYYAESAAFTVGEMRRVLKPGGRLFTTGPMPENKRLFYDLIREATGSPIPPMPGSSRYASEILDEIRRRFARVDVHVFENPLTFDTVEPFLAYTRASLSEDRRLWTSLFKGKDEFEKVMAQIAAASAARLQRDGQLVMTKVVGGFVATA